MKTIRVYSNNTDFKEFHCNGQSKNICEACRYRFKCYTELNNEIIVIPIDCIKEFMHNGIMYSNKPMYDWKPLDLAIYLLDKGE